MNQQRCGLCGARSRLIASSLGVCLECIRRSPEEALPITAAAHDRARDLFNLPSEAPRAEDGVQCVLCFRECRIPEGGRGFCGMRTVRNRRIIHMAGTPNRGLLHWYRDPLPTNCVADWVCSGHQRYGSHNLAVFYASCTLDCLFCQNWHYRETDPTLELQGSIQAISSLDLANTANRRTYCVCFFGGDPASQMPHALATGKYLKERDILVCWETAGTMHPRLLRRALKLSLESGGCIKFDLKAFDEKLHIALTNGSNQRTLQNFAEAASNFSVRPSPPLVIASTLLVPGYVDAKEVSKIAGFIAQFDPDIPYALLAFHPHFVMHDLPRTSKDHAYEALEAAQSEGLRNVHLGNVQLLSLDY
ncbi:MAG: radical SAM protein [Anaerolineales bacterium]|nr:radical SAM protein [Anaerolineales bacterium]